MAISMQSTCNQHAIRFVWDSFQEVCEGFGRLELGGRAPSTQARDEACDDGGATLRADGEVQQRLLCPSLSDARVGAEQDCKLLIRLLMPEGELYGQVLGGEEPTTARGGLLRGQIGRAEQRQSEAIRGGN